MPYPTIPEAIKEPSREEKLAVYVQAAESLVSDWGAVRRSIQMSFREKGRHGQKQI